MIRVYPESCQDTIEKWVKDGLEREEAVRKLEAILRCKLPEIIKTTVEVK